MKSSSTIIVSFVLMFALFFALTGCGPTPAEKSSPAPMQVTASYPVEREVTDHSDYTGRTAAVDSVEVRARVSGYLDKVNFKEGGLVKKGDVLFEIDPRTYEAARKKAEGELEKLEADLKFAEERLKFYTPLHEKGTVSKEEFLKVVAEKGRARGEIATAKGKIQEAELDLGFSTVTAPISGRVSRYYVTVGNLVQKGDPTGGTLLTTIVSVDLMYAYFDVDERTVLRVRQLIREGKAKSARDVAWPVFLGLANEDGYPHQGTIDFVDNQVNPKTGTLRLRGVFPNKQETLSPGYFVRVRVPIGYPHSALLITDRAIDTDQGQKIVYVVDQESKVAIRPVKLGSLHDGLRAVEDGLKSGDRVIVVGLQQVRPGMIVEPNVVDMPRSRGADKNSK
jgi:RND family efflux transporter MFP subunit